MTPSVFGAGAAYAGRWEMMCRTRGLMHDSIFDVTVSH